jgi:hypothetical protein
MPPKASIAPGNSRCGHRRQDGDSRGDEPVCSTVRPGARPKEASNVPGHSSSSRSGGTATSGLGDGNVAGSGLTRQRLKSQKP